MRAIGPFLEKHHKVTITDEALLDAVRLSHRYLVGRQLPDKAVSVLDTACARVAIGLTTSPAVLEAATRQIGQIEREAKLLIRESLVGKDHQARLEELEKQKAETRTRIDAMTSKNGRKKWEIASKIRELHLEIHQLHETDPANEMGLTEKQTALKALETDLKAIQGDAPLVQIAVDSVIISEVISGWTGIPTGRMLADEITTVLNMNALLGERIIGQGPCP